MKLDDLVDAFGKINPKYVKEAEAGRKNRIKRLVHPAWLLAAACFTLVLSSVIRLGYLRTGGDGQFASGVMESADEMDGSVEAQQENRLNINEITELQSLNYDFAQPEYTRSMNVSELEEYFGIKISWGQLSKEFALMDDGQQIYSVDYDEDHQVINDNNRLEFADKTGGRKVSLSVRTVEAGEIVNLKDPYLEDSEIYGTKAVIGHWVRESSGVEFYIAVFEKEGVYFTVQTEKLTEDEMILILEELCLE